VKPSAAAITFYVTAVYDGFGLSLVSFYFLFIGNAEFLLPVTRNVPRWRLVSPYQEHLHLVVTLTGDT